MGETEHTTGDEAAEQAEPAREPVAAGWRRVEIADETDPTQPKGRHEYQFGAEVDGVFVPAVTKTGNYIDHLVELGKQAAASDEG